MDSLADELGVEFKPSKDEGTTKPTFSLEFLGLQVSTTPFVHAHPTPHKLAKIVEQVEHLLLNPTTTFLHMEEFLGRLNFLVQAVPGIRLFVGELY